MGGDIGNLAGRRDLGLRRRGADAVTVAGQVVFVGGFPGDRELLTGGRFGGVDWGDWWAHLPEPGGRWERHGEVLSEGQSVPKSR